MSILMTLKQKGVAFGSNMSLLIVVERKYVKRGSTLRASFLFVLRSLGSYNVELLSKVFLLKFQIFPVA